MCFKLFTFSLLLISIQSLNGRSVENNIELSIANNHFCIDILHQLYDNQKNVFFSPLSISIAFAMLYTGARGETSRELHSGLGYDLIRLSDREIIEQFAEIIAQINDKSILKSYELNIANKIVTKKGFQIFDSYQQSLKKYFNSRIDSLDLISNPEAIRDSINHWVAKQTNDKIEEILPLPLDPTTRIVILSVIYFKGLFATKFIKSSTREEPFFTGELKGQMSLKTPMMKRKGIFNYTEILELDCKLLEIPYSGDDLSLYIALPNQQQGLSTLNSKLNDFKIIEKAIRRLYPIEVVVTVPKFRAEASYSLKQLLMTLGVNKVFTEDGNLSGIDSQNSLYVSEVIHKAYIDVNEEGTEAAAATAFKIMTKSAKSKPNVFKADHPFMYFIRDNNNGMVLFAGYMNKP